jgi:catechol 2,3-dioxygenase-like lactoylglutathione lyase family enzyme
MPTVSGILETAIYATDLQTTASFYRRVFDFGTLLESDRLIALDVAGRNVLLIFKDGATEGAYATPGGVIPGHGSGGKTHFAFSIRSEEADAWIQRLKESGVDIESTVDWPGGARSIYFRDPDGNLAELITAGFWRIF